MGMLSAWGPCHAKSMRVFLGCGPSRGRPPPAIDTKGQSSLMIRKHLRKHNMAADYLPSERELSRSEEEEKLLRDIREEKERLWLEIQVCRRLRLAYLAGFVVIQGTCSNNHCTDRLFSGIATSDHRY